MLDRMQAESRCRRHVRSSCRRNGGTSTGSTRAASRKPSHRIARIASEAAPATQKPSGGADASERLLGASPAATATRASSRLRFRRVPFLFHDRHATAPEQCPEPRERLEHAGHFPALAMLFGSQIETVHVAPAAFGGTLAIHVVTSLKSEHQRHHATALASWSEQRPCRSHLNAGTIFRPPEHPHFAVPSGSPRWTHKAPSFGPMISASGQRRCGRCSPIRRQDRPHSMQTTDSGDFSIHSQSINCPSCSSPRCTGLATRRRRSHSGRTAGDRATSLRPFA